ncbi:MAG: MFS transporter [Candidatus Tectomicrobia bacterium]|uniref:MFS transporter n=1 Tax=Tectimicrobiota bacterium TaxID=2528274 RepID=A0A932MR64_UNCTE|nr:MFS transporter [Candidatus Tectomicrobia bacterium]
MTQANLVGVSPAGPAPAAESFPWAAMAILVFAHFVVDSLVSMLSPLLPLLREKFQLSLSQAGLLVTTLSLSNAFAQPLTAVVVDRWPRLPWLVVGLGGSAFAMTAIGWAPSYTLVGVAVLFGGCMAGLCHPDMSLRASNLSQRYKGLAVSAFVTGGRLGFSFGPLVAIGVAGTFGMEWLWVYALIAVGAALAVRWGLPDPPAAVQIGAGGPSLLRGLQASLREAGLPLVILTGITFCRAMVNINLMGFLPTLYVERGLGLWQGGTANAILLFFGGLGVMLGGVLADRIGMRTIVVTAQVLSFLSLSAFLASPPGLGMAILAAVGISMYLMMGVGIAYAQEMMPNNRGFASSMMLGVAWGMASFSVYPISKVAEQVGLHSAFWILPGFLVVSFLLSLLLPRKAAPARQASRG